VTDTADAQARPTRPEGFYGENTVVKCGYLIVKTWERLYEEAPDPLPGEIYGIPSKVVDARTRQKPYRGIDREPLEPRSEEEERLWGDTVTPVIERPAQRRLSELERQGLVEDRFIGRIDDVLSVWTLLDRPQDFEVIWAKDHLSDCAAAESSIRLGYEPTWFTGDGFSALADCMFLPRWHGTDAEGIVFKGYFQRLNENGLFDSAHDALDFLDYYRSFDWTESGDYVIAEIRWQPMG
jgi:hypothetical protein